MQSINKQNIIIGLGGVGGRCIAEIQRICATQREKSALLQRQGVSLDYLYLDSSNDIAMHCGLSTSLAAQNFIYLDGGPDPLQRAQQSAQTVPWLGRARSYLEMECNSYTCGGTRGIRRYGRVLYALNAERIYSRLNQILSSKNLDNYVDFHIFVSLLGGTGSGAIIDQIIQIEEICKQRKINSFTHVYAFVPSSVEHLPSVMRANAFASLLDLHALSSGKLQIFKAGVPCEGQSVDDSMLMWKNNLDTLVSRIVICSDEADADIKTIEEQISYMSRAFVEQIYMTHTGAIDGDTWLRLSGHPALRSYMGGDYHERFYTFATVGIEQFRETDPEAAEHIIQIFYEKNVLGSAKLRHFKMNSEQYSNRRHCLKLGIAIGLPARFASMRSRLEGLHGLLGSRYMPMDEEIKTYIYINGSGDQFSIQSFHSWFPAHLFHFEYTLWKSYMFSLIEGAEEEILLAHLDDTGVEFNSATRPDLVQPSHSWNMECKLWRERH